MARKKTPVFDPPLLTSLYADPDLVPRFRPHFFLKSCFFSGPETLKKGAPDLRKKGGPYSEISGRKNTPSETENYRHGTPTNTIIEGVRDVAVVAASSPAVLASRQGTFADKFG
jgi:hypothetical protein